MRIRSTSVAVLTAVPLALAGCTQEGPAQAPPPKPAPAAPAAPNPAGVAWTGRLCDLVGGFADAQQHLPQLDKSSSEAFKNSSVGQITASEKAAQDTLDGLGTLGPSPIPGTAQVPDIFSKGFVQMRDILDAAKTKAQQVDTQNQQTFTAGMTGVQQELQKGQSVNLSSALTEFDKNPQLTAAAVQAPGCRALAASMQQQQQQQQQRSPG
jgi:hypothetical protein